MKNTFDGNNKQWDRFKAFYTESRGFVSFETGEVAYTNTYIKPYMRKHYPQHGVSIFSTRCPEIKAFYDQHGNKIPRSHFLHGGQQDLLIDNGRAVAIGSQGLNQDHLPQRFKYSVYAMSEKDLIKGASKVIQYRPYKMSEKDHEWLVAAQVGAKVMNKNNYTWRSYELDAAMFRMPVGEVLKQMASNNQWALSALASGGFVVGRERIEHDFITVEVV